MSRHSGKLSINQLAPWGAVSIRRLVQSGAAADAYRYSLFKKVSLRQNGRECELWVRSGLWVRSYRPASHGAFAKAIALLLTKVKVV